MIFTLIWIGILVVLAFLCFVPVRKKEYTEGYTWYGEPKTVTKYRIWDERMILDPNCMWFGIIPGFVLVICLICIMCAQVKPEMEYNSVVMERDLLVYRLENDDDLVLTERTELYEDVKYFNDKLLNNKTWYDNPWWNWFYNQKIHEIEYININDFREVTNNG